MVKLGALKVIYHFSDGISVRINPFPNSLFKVSVQNLSNASKFRKSQVNKGKIDG